MTSTCTASCGPLARQHSAPRATRLSSLSAAPCSPAACFRQTALAPRLQRPACGSAARRVAAAPRAEQQQGEIKRNTEFGYSRKDVMLIGGGLTGAGFALYYGLQATGMEPGFAGNWAQLIIFMGLTFGWVGSYLWRVATKQMTYVKQLEEYEEAVMRKRLEEMPEGEIDRMLSEVESEKEAREAKRQQRQQQP
ncbi:hypothetical protein C2E20_8723 [Micractinium conductrix]|uniref:Uncharacterized protein n=1 Tax=Micractinium conductrix TaxID=554055 RepID=A0A2P6V0K2_9CHLO|nr:hypothetical protein C2E20_8723 [Micractinium conductrix]|eukprot:PSC67626.1 hypothetical protein C2E20_8723 [Micractinium conductrix]